MKALITQKDNMITRARVNKGLTAQKFAQECGVCRAVIANIEAGTPIKAATARKVAEALGKNVDDVFNIELV